MNDDFNTSLAKSLVEQTAGKAYEDVAHPGLEATGKVLSFVPRTIRAWFSKWEKWLLNSEYSVKETEKILADKLKNVPEEKIVEPEPYVVIPALQQLSYSFDSEELREMYANLLASSMNEDKKWQVHPAFVDMIKQLCPDEAKILKYIAKKKNLPLINIKLEKGNEEGFTYSLYHYTNIGEMLCDNKEAIESYLDNLERLKLIEIPKGVYIVDNNKYKDIEKSIVVTNMMNKPTTNGAKYEIERGYFEITSFGKDFAKVCL